MRRYGGEPTSDFERAVQWAIGEARHYPDEAQQYMAGVVPVYAAPNPTPDMARAGGCADCMFLGLWAPSWPGFTAGPHGLVFLFEDGIRWQSHSGDLGAGALRVLLHEYDHALQRDHVLAGLEAAKQAGLFWPMERPAARGCGACGGR